MSERNQDPILGGIAKASGLDDGVYVCAEAIVKGKALGDATRTAGSWFPHELLCPLALDVAEIEIASRIDGDAVDPVELTRLPLWHPRPRG